MMALKGRSGDAVPTAVVVGLLMIGAGLIGMTAGDLPGIAAQLAAPRWLMGVLGGVLVGCGWQAGRVRAPGPAPRRAPSWVELVWFGLGGIALAWLSQLTRDAEGAGDALGIGIVINTAARVLFGIGIGIVVGWAAYEGAESRRRHS
jgi:hypothetical protein